MELVDRSPQRSPRGSIASECLNQSPRSSIVPAYERSSRGSIGVNEAAHRGSIGANEEEARSPRRGIDPEHAIDRTPRGSLSGLQERRGTKASLIAQDPRRGSADQGVYMRIFLIGGTVDGISVFMSRIYFYYGKIVGR